MDNPFGVIVGLVECNERLLSRLLLVFNVRYNDDYGIHLLGPCLKPVFAFSFLFSKDFKGSPVHGLTDVVPLLSTVVRWAVLEGFLNDTGETLVTFWQFLFDRGQPIYFERWICLGQRHTLL